MAQHWTPANCAQGRVVIEFVQCSASALHPLCGTCRGMDGPCVRPDTSQTIIETQGGQRTWGVQVQTGTRRMTAARWVRSQCIRSIDKTSRCLPLRCLLQFVSNETVRIRKWSVSQCIDGHNQQWPILSCPECSAAE